MAKSNLPPPRPRNDLRPAPKNANPRMVDLPGPKDRTTLDQSDYNSKGMTPNNYKSPENQKGSIAGVRDNSAGAVQELKRSTPNAGVYQSGNNPRGGAATGSYDSKTDAPYNSYTAPGLDELRAKQDRASGKRKGEND